MATKSPPALRTHLTRQTAEVQRAHNVNGTQWLFSLVAYTSILNVSQGCDATARSVIPWMSAAQSTARTLLFRYWDALGVD